MISMDFRLLVARCDEDEDDDDEDEDSGGKAVSNVALAHLAKATAQLRCAFKEYSLIAVAP